MTKSPQRSQTAHDLMLDPSILLSPTSFKALAANGSDLKTDRLFVPRSFMLALRAGGVETEVASRFAPELPRPPREETRAGIVEPVGRDVVVRITREAEPGAWAQLPGWIEEHGIASFQPTKSELASARRNGALEIAETLRDLHGGRVGEILFEEWLFLQTHSWIASRRKWVFTQFIRAGGISIEAGRRSYEAATQKARDEIPQLLTRQGAKRTARWMGTTGAAWFVKKNVPGSNLAEALLASGLGAGAGMATNKISKRVFVLIDP
jgi:hypothetical protein